MDMFVVIFYEAKGNGKDLQGVLILKRGRVLTMTDKLKHCPFCGGEAELFEIKGVGNDMLAYMVGCTESNCEIRPSVQKEPDKEGTIKLWNRRADNDR